MSREDIKSKIMSYLEEVKLATRNEISKQTGITGRVLTQALKELVDKGYLEVVSKNPLTYKFVEKNYVELDFSKIRDYYNLKYTIAKILKNHGWRLSKHEIAAVALIYSKFTGFKTLVFGSQAVGKTSIIRSVFQGVKEPVILQDLHLKDLYDVVGSIKENTKVIEQQYRHKWGRETLERYDAYKVVPLSRIGPAELIFRFIPVRIIQPKGKPERLFEQVYFEFLNIPRIINPPEDAIEALYEELSHIEYFTIDTQQLEEALKKIKVNEVVGFTEDGTAEFYRINERYKKITQNDFFLANFKEFKGWDSLYNKMSDNLQIINNALEVLKFNFSWLQEKDAAVEQTVDFFKDVFETFTIVKKEKL